MFRRGLALCAVLGFASVVNAGAVVTLVPGQAGPYNVGDTFNVDVKLTQDAGGSDVLARLIRFDFNASNPGIQLNSFNWDFSGAAICAGGFDCSGSGYNTFADLTDVDGKVVNVAFPGTAPSAFLMIKLPTTGQITVGRLNLTLTAPGDLLLDAMNPLASALEPNNKGAALEFDFVNRQSWRPGSGLSLGGEGGGAGTVAFLNVVPEPATLMLLGLGGVAAAMRRRTA